jgi:hypothetical protein
MGKFVGGGRGGKDEDKKETAEEKGKNVSLAENKDKYMEVRTSNRGMEKMEMGMEKMEKMEEMEGEKGEKEEKEEKKGEKEEMEEEMEEKGEKKRGIPGFWRVACRWIYRRMGWSYGPLEGVGIAKCIICVAPHTSNWDFIVGKIFYTSIGCNARFLIKKEWFRFPLNLIFGPLGGVPVDRSRAALLTDEMVKEFSSRESFQVAITPEGTRKAAKEWKRGFYYIAQAASVPILLIYMDYAKKEMGVCGVFHPTGDARGDILAIRSHYRGFCGRHRENFVEV